MVLGMFNQFYFFCSPLFFMSSNQVNPNVVANKHGKLATRTSKNTQKMVVFPTDEVYEWPVESEEINVTPKSPRLDSTRSSTLYRVTGYCIAQ
jgi:hypothetical protein